MADLRAESIKHILINLIDSLQDENALRELQNVSSRNDAELDDMACIFEETIVKLKENEEYILDGSLRF